MTPCVGFINYVLYVYKGPPLCTKTSGTLSEPDPKWVMDHLSAGT